MKENLPEVSSDVLEENGKVYYMNGKNGTEFDWFVNNHLPTFMVFYNDEKNFMMMKTAAGSSLQGMRTINISIM